LFLHITTVNITVYQWQLVFIWQFQILSDLTPPCLCFVDHYLSFCAFSFGHCVVCSSSIYGLWLPLWYLQTLLKYKGVFSIKYTSTLHCKTRTKLYHEVLTKSGTYPWSFVTQIFHNGQPSHLKLFHISYSYKVGASIMNLCFLTSVSGLQINNDFIQDTEKYPFLNTSRFFPHSWLITGFVTRLTRRVSLMEQELLTLPGFSVICMFCRSLFVLLCLFIWPLCCLFFDIRIMIAPLVSSISS
jgi:hypothetical protein